MITKEEIEKAVEVCTDGNMDCTQCPLGKRFYRCGVYFALYIKENEPAPAATGTSSEISKDTNSTHLDDSTLLDICQEGIEEMAKIALDDYPNEFLTGYVEAFKHNIERLRGGDGK
ncbi:hypothetical protein [Ruminococcus bicirculans (ex Wegman et al. 2014)]|jgi:hypothetical protein|uniref:hypothetical protein n=1 Tax=Ruminococcus bicirculans (ex Wegman et al. 2014) TaxID=1160721 RepID=UPI002430927B|nr:hypothetical protein [Ruminococcus bicirculans (ex Wegman et al. 2014)]MBS6920010.1 hypothetical protein [Ruminococcus bicirculans (ex Wegman et al. 2014)]MEE1434710.1 hypothetical protein [Ruminococcus sp.]